MTNTIHTGINLSLSYNNQTLVYGDDIIIFNFIGENIFKLNRLTYKEEDMGDCSITCELMIPADKDPQFTFDWYIEFNGERFYNKTLLPPAIKTTDSLQYKYSLTFVSEREDLKRDIFTNLVTSATQQPRTEKDFAFIGDIAQFADRFNLNLLSSLGDRWVMIISEGVTSLQQTVVCNKIKLWDLLKQVYTIYNLRWRISYDSNLKKMVIRILNESTDAIEIDHEFEYGANNGLIEVERLNPTEQITTRLSGRGGSQNIPDSYFHDGDPDENEHTLLTYFTNLMPKCYRDYVRGWNGTPLNPQTPAYEQGVADKLLGVWNPTDYIDSENMDIYGRWHDCLEDNEEIYPTIQGLTDEVLGRLDEVVAVEPVLNDNYESVDSSSTGNYNDVPDVVISQFIGPMDVVANEAKSSQFVIDKDINKVSFHIIQTPNVIYGDLIDYSTVISISLINASTSLVVDTLQYVDSITHINTLSLSFDGYFEDVPTGGYYLRIGVESTNSPNEVNVTTELDTIKIENYTKEDYAYRYKQTFDIWVKNVWGSTYQDTGHETETPQEFVNRIWNPLTPSSSQGEMTIMWSSGLLAGEDYEFVVTAINYDVSVSGAMWRLTLKKSDAELQASNKYLPNKVINAVPGDYFFFINIILPHTYVLDAEERVNSYISTELSKVDAEIPTYTAKPSKVFCATFAESDKIRVGSRLFLKDERLVGTTAVGFYIITLTKEYTPDSMLPDWDIVISDKVVSSISSVKRLQGDVQRLSNAMYSNEQTITMLVKQFDKYFLRKDGLSQSSESSTSFNKDLFAGKNILSKDFVKGLLTGDGFGIFRDENGDSVIEVDKLNIRKTLFANELVISQVSFYGGRYLYSAAGMEAKSVEDTGSVYRVYMDTKQGTVLNQFVVGDQAYCQRFTPTDNSIIKYYWRLVVAVGVDYIDLSKSDMDGSGIPEEGDNIAQVGNRTQTSRQSVLIIDQLSGGSVVQYAGIDSYEWTDKNYVGYGVNPETGDAYLYCYGDMFIGDRDREAEDSTWLAFEREGEETKRKLRLKGVMEFVPGSKGLYDLAEWFDVDARITAASPYFIDLINENASVACDSLGNVIGTLPKSQVNVYVGGVLDTGWGFTGSAVGCTGTLHPTTGAIEITALTDDNATYNVTATKTDKPTLTAVMTISKVRGGSSGESVTIYSVSPSVNVIKVSKSGTINPNTISCVKIKQEGNSAPEVTTEKVLKYQISGASESDYSTAIATSASWIYIDFILYDNDGVTILDRERVPVVSDGTDGLSGSSLVVTTNRQVFLYDAAGNLVDTGGYWIYTTLYNPPSGTMYYEFKKNGVTVQNGTYSVLGFVAPSTYNEMPISYEVIARMGSTSGQEVGRDMITISGVKPGAPGTPGEDGKDAYTVILTNETHAMPATSTGVVSSYANSGTDIMVWLGVNQVPYGSGANTFDVYASGTGITVGSASTVSSYTRRFADHSAMTGDNASVVYTIRVRDASNNQVILTRTQTFAKAKSGTDADAQAAKDDMARALGYNSYADMLEKNNERGTLITNYGYIRTGLIDVLSILTNSLSTAATQAGERVFINKATNSIHVYDSLGVERVWINGKELSGFGATESTFTCANKTGSISRYTAGESVGTYTYGGSNTLATIEPIAANNTVTIPPIQLRFECTGINVLIGDSALINAYIYAGSILLGSFEYNAAAHGSQETFDLPSSSISLAVGTSLLTVVFEYILYVEPGNPGFEVKIDTTFSPSTGNINYSNNKTEIAKNGMRWMWASNKYFEVSANTSTNAVKIEARNGNYGIAITDTGLKKMTDGSNWVNL